MANYRCACGELIDDVRFPNPKIFHAVRDDDIEAIQRDIVAWVLEAVNGGNHLHHDFEDDLLQAIDAAFDGPLYSAHPDLSRERFLLVCPDCGRIHLLSMEDSDSAQVTWQLETGNPWAL